MASTSVLLWRILSAFVILCSTSAVRQLASDRCNQLIRRSLSSDARRINVYLNLDLDLGYEEKADSIFVSLSRVSNLKKSYIFDCRWMKNTSKCMFSMPLKLWKDGEVDVVLKINDKFECKGVRVNAASFRKEKRNVDEQKPLGPRNTTEENEKNEGEPNSLSSNNSASTSSEMFSKVSVSATEKIPATTKITTTTTTQSTSNNTQATTKITTTTTTQSTKTPTTRIVTQKNKSMETTTMPETQTTMEASGRTNPTAKTGVTSADAHPTTSEFSDITPQQESENFTQNNTDDFTGDTGGAISSTQISHPFLIAAIVALLFNLVHW